jgi:hypothetical protein
MNQVKLQKVWITALLLTMAASFSLIADAAEKREQSYVKTNFRTLYKTVLPVGDVPNHEIVIEASAGDIKFSPNLDFKIKEEWVYIQSDLIDGSGTQSGYYYDTHEDGSHTYGTFKGTIKTTSKADGSWEAIWECTYEYRGGSGKYKNIKGSGKCKGKASTQDPIGREEGRETLEY